MNNKLSYQCNAIYEDESGKEDIVIDVNRDQIQTTIRGIDFYSVHSFGLDPKEYNVERLVSGKFHIHPISKSLYHYSLTVFLPFEISIADSNESIKVFMEYTCSYGYDSVAKGNTTILNYSAVLKFNDQIYKSKINTQDSFSSILNELQNKINGVFVGCYNCKLGEYHVGIDSEFASLVCLKKYKEEKLKLTTQEEDRIFMSRIDELKSWDYVSENAICEEFVFRKRY